MATRRPSDLRNFSLPSPGTKETNEHHPHSEPGKFRSAAQIASSAESDLLTAPSVLRKDVKEERLPHGARLRNRSGLPRTT